MTPRRGTAGPGWRPYNIAIDARDVAVNGSRRGERQPDRNSREWHSDNLMNRYLAQGDFDEWRRGQSGDPDLFPAIDLAEIEDPPDVTFGPEGIWPLGRVSYQVGEANAGKTPILCYTALTRVRSAMEHGYPGSFGTYELEMGAPRMRALYRALGATRDELRRLPCYGDLAKPRDLLRHGAALASRALEDGCILGFGFDTLITMLKVSGLDENSPTDVRSWVDAAARQFLLDCDTLSVIINDHLGKTDKEVGRGTSDKNAAVDFAAVLRLAPLGKAGKRGVSGNYQLRCKKDRDAVAIDDSMDMGHQAFANGTFTYNPAGWTGAVGEVTPMRQPAPTQDLVADYLRDNGPSRLPAIAAALEPFLVAELGRPISGAESEAWQVRIGSALKRGKRGRQPRFAQVDRGLWYLNGSDGSA